MAIEVGHTIYRAVIRTENGDQHVEILSASVESTSAKLVKFPGYPAPEATKYRMQFSREAVEAMPTTPEAAVAQALMERQEAIQVVGRTLQNHQAAERLLKAWRP